jgi:hypothetical protein
MRHPWALLIVGACLGACSQFDEVVDPIEPPTAAIVAVPDTVAPGEHVALHLNSTHADHGGVEPPGHSLVNGTVVVRPEETTLYVFDVEGPGGTASDSALVVVLDGARDPRAVAVVQDSLIFEFTPVEIVDEPWENLNTEASLGFFTLPDVFNDSTVAIWVEVSRSDTIPAGVLGAPQIDEAFAVGTVEWLPPGQDRRWIYPPESGCPVVEDPNDPEVGTTWEFVGHSEPGLSQALEREVVARHAVEFSVQGDANTMPRCYTANDPAFVGLNSLTFRRIKFVFWREVK